MNTQWLYLETCCLRLICLVILLGGCDDIVEPLPSPIWISEIEITDEYESTRLEVEVHVVDAITGQLLGCAGANTGLRKVDYPDVLYRVDADIVKPDGGLLYYEEIRYREIEIWVIEDDLDPCPGPFIPGVDDIIGISRPLAGRELGHFHEFSFGNVIQLRIGS